MLVTKIVSGGQTGVDRAALDVALQLGLSCGGWCPRGRRAEDGPIPDRYPLTETSSEVYPQRTRQNVRDSDGTLVLTLGPPRGGTALTIALAERFRKPHLVVDLTDRPNAGAVRTWVCEQRIQVLNVAGPRASENPDIDQVAAQFLHEVLTGDAPLPLASGGA